MEFRVKAYDNIADKLGSMFLEACNEVGEDGSYTRFKDNIFMFNCSENAMERLNNKLKPTSESNLERRQNVLSM